MGATGRGEHVAQEAQEPIGREAIDRVVGTDDHGGALDGDPLPPGTEHQRGARLTTKVRELRRAPAGDAGNDLAAAKWAHHDAGVEYRRLDRTVGTDRCEHREPMVGRRESSDEIEVGHAVMIARRATMVLMSLAILDWRRQVTALYAQVRATTDPQAAHVLWRAGRDELFAHHPASPLLPDDRARFTGLPYAPYDPEMRFEAAVDTGVDAARLEVPTGTDGVVPFERIGRVLLGDLGSLDVWWLASYGGGVFVPMKDRSPHTYGGGRYVLDTVKGADLGGAVDPATGRATLVIDLNFAYNPSCAYDPAWACPLAPPGNVLGVDLAAGELTSTGA